MEKKLLKWMYWGILLLFASCASMVKKESAEILQSVPFHRVHLEDNFWLPRLKTQKEILVPFALEKTRPAMDNLRKTGNFLKGIKDELPFTHRIIASDM